MHPINLNDWGVYFIDIGLCHLYIIKTLILADSRNPMWMQTRDNPLCKRKMQTLLRARRLMNKWFIQT